MMMTTLEIDKTTLNKAFLYAEAHDIDLTELVKSFLLKFSDGQIKNLNRFIDNTDCKPYTLEELNSRISEAETDIASGKTFSTEEVMHNFNNHFSKK